MLKRYCAYCSKYSTILQLEDGRNITLEFTGKNPITKERFVDVSDPLIQKALEESKYLGIYHYASKEWDWMQDESELTEKNTVIPGAITVNNEPEKVKVKGLKKKEFSTVKDAKSWLNTEHEVSFALLGNKQMIIEKAKELGFELVFPN